MGFKTVAPGVLVREDGKRTYKGRPDRYFTIRYRVEGKRYQEALGWASDGWNVAKAQAELARLKAAAVTGDGAVTLRQRREEAQAKREQEENAPTLGKIWHVYRETLASKRMQQTYDSAVRRHLQEMMPLRVDKLRTHHIDALRRRLEDKGLAAQTVKHQLALIRQLVRWAAIHGYCEMPPLHLLHFALPTVQNQVTEMLTPQQIKKLLDGLSKYDDQAMALALQLALATGIRRHALFCLTWDDLDFTNRQIRLRAENAKSGKTAFVTMNSTAEKILRAVIPTNSPLVFSEKNFQSSRVKRLISYAKQFLPEGFRPFHGLRHAFASMLASSGQVSMFELQRLLTHASPEMAQRYGHLHDQALKRASAVMDDVFQAAANDAAEPQPAKSEESPGRMGKAKVWAFRPAPVYEKGKP